MNKKHININNDDVQYKVHKGHQRKYSDTHKGPLSFPMWSTVAKQCEDGGPWSNQRANNSDYNGRSYIVRVMKMAV